MNPSKPAEEGLCCHYCEERFSTDKDFCKHVSRHEKGLVCSICNQTFSRRYLLEMHRRKYAGERPYTCAACNKKFHSKTKMKLHIFSHGGKIPNLCDICGKILSHKFSLDRHRLIHTENKPYACKICEKQFTQKGNLDRHLLTHVGIKPHACDFCGKQFSQKGHLKVHSLFSCGKDPHVSDICENKFSQKVPLNTQLQICKGKRKMATTDDKKLRKNVVNDIADADRNSIEHVGRDSSDSVSCVIPQKNWEKSDSKESDLAEGRALYFVKLSTDERGSDSASAESTKYVDCETSNDSESCINEVLHDPWDLNISSTFASLESAIAQQSNSSGSRYSTLDLLYDRSMLGKEGVIMTGSPGDVSDELYAIVYNSSPLRHSVCR